MQERTGGRIHIIVESEAKLGSESEVLEQIKYGGIAFARVSLSQIAEQAPEMNVLQLPYLYRDSEHMWRVLDGEILRECARESAEYERVLWKDREEQSRQTAIANGTCVSTLSAEEKEKEELKKWYQGLTEEQLSFVRSAIQEEEYKRLGLEEENRANEVDKLTAYLKKNLSKTQYTYISDEYTSVRIGIPSNKYRETIESLYRKYSKTNPNSVTVFYELCPLSLKELEKAMEELQKDSQLKKMMENNLGALFINQSWIDLYWTNGVPKGFEEWLSNNQYQKLIYVRENQKPLLLDSPGL